MDAQGLLGAATHDNVAAWLRVIREGESSQDDDVAFRIIVGGQHFDSFDHHPQVYVPQPDGSKSSAAGAFQITYTTWKDYIAKYGDQPFAPANQTLCAIWLTYRRGALDDVIAGRLDAAIRKCTREWTSLAIPKRQAEAPSIFAACGGREADSSVPVAPDTPVTKEINVTPHVTEAQHMPAVLLALLPSILQMLPQLIPVLSAGHNSDEAKMWQGAGTVIANTLQTATNTDNLVQAVAAMQTNPDALAAAHAAVNDLLPQLVEAGGGGIDGARKSNTDPAQIPFWKQPSFYFLILSLPLVYMLAMSVLFGLGGTTWSDDARMMVATGILAVLAGGSAYFWGSSSGSQKKTDALTAR